MQFEEKIRRSQRRDNADGSSNVVMRINGFLEWAIPPRLASGQLLLLFAILTVLPHSGGAALLLEEGFNYFAGSNLAGNASWVGSGGTSIGVVSGNLSLPNLSDTVPLGNMLSVGGGPSRSNYRNFSAMPVANVAGESVYCSVLINCTLLPTNSQHIASLLTGGSTSFNGSDDPLALYLRNASAGYSFRISHHGENASAQKILAENTTHFIVLKYTFGGSGQCSLYIDPTPGNAEPATPDAVTEDDEGHDFPNLQVVGLKAPNLASQGSWNFDTLRIGTNWSEVTPPPHSLAITGPQNQVSCSGQPVTFRVNVVGTSPFGYWWRTNGIAIPNATNDTYTLTDPGPSQALSAYDVVVNDAFNSMISSVATLTITTIAPLIAGQPTNQILSPGSTAVFTVVATGDQPLTYQWRTNGIAIAGATNRTYSLTSPTDSDALNFYDAVVANPCGVVTSTPPATLSFTHSFYGSDALPGFFGGMNLITTNSAAINLYVWSVMNRRQPISNWTLEGQMLEQPLNDGSGNSRYSMNVNPAVSPVFYLIGMTTSSPYLPEVPVQWITTDEGGNYAFFITNLLISSSGILNFPQPRLTPQLVTTDFQFSGSGLPGDLCWIQAATNLNPPVVWFTLATNVAGLDGFMQFTDTNVTTQPRRFYRLIYP